MTEDYTCAVCGGTFLKRPDAEAEAEAEAFWGVKDAHARTDFAIICDDCFARRTEDEREAMGQEFKRREPAE